MWTAKTRIADIKIEFHSRYYSITHTCKKYLSEFSEPDMIIDINDEDIQAVTKKIDDGESHLPSYCETVIAYEKLCEQLWKFDALMLHAATICVEGRAISFAARSGTGKTTHMLLWQKLLKSQMTVINGDKPIIRFLNNIPYAYGTPWCGKESISENLCAPLCDICFIERDSVNSVQRLSKTDAIQYIFKQIFLPKDQTGMSLTIQMIDQLLNSVDLWIIHCNMNIEAAQVAYETIVGGKINNETNI